MREAENFGVGVDIENVQRFRDLDRRKDKEFLDKIYTSRELDYCFGKDKAGPHLAGRFVGKEATYKALSSLKVKVNTLKEIEILNDELGAPKVIINRQEGELVTNLTLSHTKDLAIGFAMVVK